MRYVALLVGAVICMHFSAGTTCCGAEASDANGFAPVAVGEVPGVLTMLAGKAKDNYDRIKTWQGKVYRTATSVHDGNTAARVFRDQAEGKGSSPRSLGEESHSLTEFAFDCRKVRSYERNTYTEPLKFTDAESGVGVVSRDVADWETVSVGTPEYSITCRPDRKRGSVVTSRKAIKETVAAGERLAYPTGRSDPRREMMPGGPVWEFFPQLAAGIRKHGMTFDEGYAVRVDVRGSGATADYRLQLPMKDGSGRVMIQTVVLSGKSGLNVISSTTVLADQRPWQSVTWKYEVVGGIYVPSEKTQVNYSVPDGRIMDDRRWVFSDSRINEPIAEKTFTYENLGLKEGDLLEDRIQKKTFVFQGGKLAEQSEAELKASLPLSGAPLMLKYSEKVGLPMSVSANGSAAMGPPPAGAIVVPGQVISVKQPLVSSPSTAVMSTASIRLEKPMAAGGRRYGVVLLVYDQYALPGGPIHAGDKLSLIVDAQGRLIDVYPADAAGK